MLRYVRIPDWVSYTSGLTEMGVREGRAAPQRFPSLGLPLALVVYQLLTRHKHKPNSKSTPVISLRCFSPACVLHAHNLSSIGASSLQGAFPQEPQRAALPRQPAIPAAASRTGVCPPRGDVFASSTWGSHERPLWQRDVGRAPVLFAADDAEVVAQQRHLS